MRSRAVLASVFTSIYFVCLASNVADAQHADFELFVDEANKIQAEETESLVLFDEGTLFTDDPGFDNHDDSFPVGARIGFSAVEKLFYSSGGAAVPATTGLSLTFTRAENTLAVHGASATQKGFAFAIADENHGFHEHMGYQLVADGVAPLPGLYATLISFESDGLESSDPALVAFGLLGEGFSSIDGINKAMAYIRAYAYPIAGDVNRDGEVKLADFAVIRRNFNKAVTHWEDGDVTGDGVVNLQDFALLRTNFGNSAPGLSAPEPTLPVWALASAAIFRLRRRR